MGEIEPGDQSAADANLASVAASGARLVASLLGWPCGFVAVGHSDTLHVEQHGDLALEQAALATVAASVAALGRTVVSSLTPGAPVLADCCRLPPGSTGMVATPLIGEGGETSGVVGALDDGRGSTEPAAPDALVDLAALLSASIASHRRLVRLGAEAAKAAAAEHREARLRAALDSLPHFFWVTDKAGRYVEQNAWDREAFGDLTGNTTIEAALPVQQGAFWQERHRRVLGGETLRYASWRRHPGGDGDRWVESVMAPLMIDGGIEGLVGLTVDRTEQATMAERLRASEARFRAAIDALPCGLFICDLDDRHLVQNRADRQERGDIVGKTCDEADLPSVIMDWVPEVLAQIPAGETLRCEMTYERHGRRVAVEKMYAPIAEDGVVTSYVSLTIDHTDRASAERRLAEAEGRLRAAIDALPFPFFICDLDGRHVLQNKLDREIWGDCIGKTFAETGLPPELSDYVPSAIDRVRRGETVHSSLAYERAGQRHYEDQVYAPVYADGAIDGFVGLTIDHTAEVEHERRLSESEARLADYVDTASDWVWETDAEHRLVALVGMPAAPKLPAAKVLGRRRWELAGAAPTTDPLWRDHLADLEAGRPFRGLVFSLTGIDQATFWVEINGNPIRDATGACIGYRGTGRDVTDRVEAEQRLKDSEARLADYLATASDWLWETDAEHRITSLAGWPADALLAADRLIGRRRWDYIGAVRPAIRSGKSTFAISRPGGRFAASSIPIRARITQKSGSS